MNWALVSQVVIERRALSFIPWSNTSHRFVVCQPAVSMSRLQPAQSWSDKQNNKYNRKNNTYNSLCTAGYVGLY